MLLHELNNHTQYLSALGALESTGDPLPGLSDGLMRTAREVEELGWLLGLCAGGYGADLLRDRSEAEGLRPLVRFVRKALRRAGRDLERADRELPTLSPRLGWRGAWRVGELLFACANPRGTGALDPTTTRAAVPDCVASAGQTALASSVTALAWDLESDEDALILTCRVAPSSVAGSVHADVLACSETGSDWIRFRIAPRAAP